MNMTGIIRHKNGGIHHEDERKDRDYSQQKADPQDGFCAKRRRDLPRFCELPQRHQTSEGETLNRIAEQLQLTPEFLKDDTQDLELTIEERFIKRVCASEADKAQAAQFLAQSRGLFAGNALNDDDKEALLRCLWDIYEDSRKDKK